MSPLVSIIIPNYNREELLKEALDSVIAQTYKNWEVVVIDDDSTDHSIEVLQEYAKTDNRIRYYRRASNTKGACTCRNEGFKKSKGEFIIFLDSDDMLAPFCLEKRIKAAKCFPEYDFWVFSTLEFEKKPGDLDILINVFTTEDPLNRFLKIDVVWLATGPFWKREIIDKIGGWDENLKSGQDWDLSIRVIASGFRFLYFNDIDNYWRINSPDKITNNNFSNEHLQLKPYLYSKLFEFLKMKNQLSEERKRLIRVLYISNMLNMVQRGKYKLLKIAIDEERRLFPEKRKVQILTYVFIRFYMIGLGRNRVPGLIRYINACKMGNKTLKTVKYQALRLST